MVIIAIAVNCCFSDIVELKPDVSQGTGSKLEHRGGNTEVLLKDNKILEVCCRAIQTSWEGILFCF